MDEIEWWEFDSAGEMAEQVAGDVGFVIESAIAAHGNARIAVPGGDTPDLAFQRLLKSKIDWSKVTLIPTDDRLVALDAGSSNYRKLDGLFARTGATVISLVDEAALADPQEAGRRADARLARLEWPLDLVWLGVDEEGHVAGMVPGPDFERAIAGPRERRAVGVRPDRVTLTAAALKSARTMMIVLAGQSRRAAVEAAISEGPLSSKAIGRLVADSEVPIDIFWSAE